MGDTTIVQYQNTYTVIVSILNMYIFLCQLYFVAILLFLIYTLGFL